VRKTGAFKNPKTPKNLRDLPDALCSKPPTRGCKRLSLVSVPMLVTHIPHHALPSSLSPSHGLAGCWPGGVCHKPNNRGAPLGRAPKTGQFPFYYALSNLSRPSLDPLILFSPGPARGSPPRAEIDHFWSLYHQLIHIPGKSLFSHVYSSILTTGSYGPLPFLPHLGSLNPGCHHRHSELAHACI